MCVASLNELVIKAEL